MVGSAALVLAVVVAILVQSARTSSDSAVPRNPAPGTGDAAFAIGPADAPVTVDVYEDFLCPVCRRFEEQAGGNLDQLVREGTVQVRYRPIAILDRFSTDDYSTRALNAAAVVADAAGVEAFLAFHDELFAAQPPEGGPGLSDEELIDLAARAGAGGTRVADGIRDLRFAGWAARVTDQASREGITGTPTVLVDGAPLADRSPAGLEAAVRAAASAR
ncbi:MAG TPA: thioredoxin domain-containing protein [Geodermatophilus sp.]|nr:thioredoxin domain-containing protein [Geodermatophilus sp.]